MSNVIKVYNERQQSISVKNDTPPPALQETVIENNGVFMPEKGFVGFGEVTVNVPPYGEGEVEITSNGTHNVSGKAVANVNVPMPLLQEKTATENGVYTADEGYFGLSKVTVNLPSPDSLIERSITEIESGVTTIGSYAFYNYKTLTRASFPNATSIGSYAFSGCKASVYFPKMTKITGYNAFSGAFNSMDITQDSFPMATEIDKNVFYSSQIKSANFPKVTSIGKYAFQSCSYLISVDFAEALTTDNSVFESCSKLVSVNLPKLTHLGANAFQSCSSLETIDLPEVVTLGYSTSGGMFTSCSKLKSVNLPKLQTLGMSFFQYCKALTEVYLPQVSVQITKYAFYNCNALETVILPKCTSISSDVFSYCYSLKKLVLGTEATTRYVLNSTSSFYQCYHILGTTNSTYNPNGDKDGYIYVPLSRVQEVRNTTNWVTYASQIMPWVATIDDLASIDGTLYDHACVGEGVDSVEYVYNGVGWVEFIRGEV